MSIKGEFYLTQSPMSRRHQKLYYKNPKRLYRTTRGRKASKPKRRRRKRRLQ